MTFARSARWTAQAAGRR